jgi:hypothetical protein
VSGLLGFTEGKAASGTDRFSSVIQEQRGETLLLAAPFSADGGLGIASYLSLLAYGVYRAKKFVSQQTIRRITIVFGVALLGLAIYFIVQSVSVLSGVPD